jgi:hypothetical protein
MSIYIIPIYYLGGIRNKEGICHLYELDKIQRIFINYFSNNIRYYIKSLVICYSIYL